jgi:hypothetical protein
MTDITVNITSEINLHLTCAQCHKELEVTHQANDFSENWIEVKPHICKE